MSKTAAPFTFSRHNQTCMNIHFVGINGVSMRALSRLATSQGDTVTGSDAATTGHDPENVNNADLVVYTNAVPEDNVELVSARRLGIQTVERAEYLGKISKQYKTVVAIAGCHGKSTTAAMTGAALIDLNPTVHVGVADCSSIGGTDLFVTEACEYNRSFLHLAPDTGVILNVGYDHPDCYKDKNELTEAYKTFGRNCKNLIVNADDGGLFPSAITFGKRSGCNYFADDVKSDFGKRSFTLIRKGKRAVRVSLNVFGGHNVLNAVAAIAAAEQCGVDAVTAARRLEKFRGLPRRFEYKGTAFGKVVISDYAHHPEEIAATVRTAHEIFPSVAVVFQPHTYSRTKALKEDFAAALSKAESVILAPIFPARETDDLGVSSETIAKLMKAAGKPALCLDKPDIKAYCKTAQEKAIIFMGAGDIDKTADEFLSDSLS